MLVFRMLTEPYSPPYGPFTPTPPNSPTPPTLSENCRTLPALPIPVLPPTASLPTPSTLSLAEDDNLLFSPATPPVTHSPSTSNVRPVFLHYLTDPNKPR